MPVQININGLDAAEALRELSSLASGFNGVQVVTPEKEDKPEEPKRQRSASETTKKNKPAAKQEPDKEPEAADETAADSTDGVEMEIPTDVQLRSTAADKAKSAGREKVKALLDKYSVPNVTAVPDDKRIAFLKELEELE